MADDADERQHSHLIAFPEALEAFFTRVGELKILLGPAGAGGVGAVEALIRDGLAARERGDVPTAIARIVEAMDQLAVLVSDADPAEGAMMRAMAATFRQALGHGAMGQAREATDVMRERSGSVITPRRDR